jgi:hypothetical protein
MRVKMRAVFATALFMIDLEPHLLAALFPPISEEELAELGRDIALHGQLEPIVLYQGKILDGVNRYRACRRMDREPWTTEFNQESVKRTPEQYVIAANVRRRHLTPAQKAAIAVEWAERVEQDWAEGRCNTIVARVEKSGVQGGRPKTRALEDTAVLLGVSVAAAYEARRIKTANETFFAELKAGRRSLGSALDEIHSPASEPDKEPAISSTEADEAVPEIPAANQPEDDEPVGVPIFGASPMAVPPPPIASKLAAPRLSRKERIAGAWLEVERVFGAGKYTKWLRDGRLTDDEALEFEKLASDADKKQVRAVMLQNRSFREAVGSLTGLNPQNTIEDLHTKTVQSGGPFVGQIGEFLHVVAFGEQGRAELLKRLEGWLAN